MGATISKSQLAGMTNEELAVAVSRLDCPDEDLQPFVDRIRLLNRQFFDGAFVANQLTVEDWQNNGGIVQEIYMANLDFRLGGLIILQSAWQESVMNTTTNNTNNNTTSAASATGATEERSGNNNNNKDGDTTTHHDDDSHEEEEEEEDTNTSGGGPIISNKRRKTTKTTSPQESNKALASSLNSIAAQQASDPQQGSATTNFLHRSNRRKTNTTSPQEGKAFASSNSIAVQEASKQQQGNTTSFLRRSSRRVANYQAGSALGCPAEAFAAVPDSDANGNESSSAFFDLDEEDSSEPDAKWEPFSSSDSNENASSVCQQQKQRRMLPKRKHAGSAKKMPVTASTTTGRQKRNDYTFDERLEQLLAYKITHGHCNVPARGSKLGHWVHNVRCGATKVTTNQRAKLSAMGFQWRLRKCVPFDTRLELLEAYKRKYGNCNVPKNNPDLGQWVKDVRRGRIKLSDDQINILEKMEFVWKADRSGPRSI